MRAMKCWRAVRIAMSSRPCLAHNGLINAARFAGESEFLVISQEAMRLIARLACKKKRVSAVAGESICT